MSRAPAPGEATSHVRRLRLAVISHLTLSREGLGAISPHVPNSSPPTALSYYSTSYLYEKPYYVLSTARYSFSLVNPSDRRPLKLVELLPALSAPAASPLPFSTTHSSQLHELPSRCKSILSAASSAISLVKTRRPPYWDTPSTVHTSLRQRPLHHRQHTLALLLCCNFQTTTLNRNTHSDNHRHNVPASVVASSHHPAPTWSRKRTQYLLLIYLLSPYWRLRSQPEAGLTSQILHPALALLGRA